MVGFVLIILFFFVRHATKQVSHFVIFDKILIVWDHILTAVFFSNVGASGSITTDSSIDTQDWARKLIVSANMFDNSIIQVEQVLVFCVVNRS